jgi:colanic acid/amylovoran biosynthesis glycosyltransferase
MQNTPRVNGDLSRLRVAHLVEHYLPISENWLHRLVVGVPGVEATVLAGSAIDPGGREFPVDRLLIGWRDAPVRSWFASRCPEGHWRQLRVLAGHLRALDVDVVHAHFGPVAWAWLPALSANRPPLVTSFYGHDMSELPAQVPAWRQRYAALFARANRILCEGPAMKRGIVALGCAPDRIAIQRLGIERPAADPPPRRFEPGRRLRVLAAGRFKEKKGLPDAIAAVAIASGVVDVSLTIVGGPADDEAQRQEASRIHQAARASGLGDRLTFAGVVAHGQFLALARTHDVFLQPSRTAASGDTEGGLPVALLEAAATGTAVVATRHADIPDAVLDGVTGLLAGEGDIEGLAAHVVRLAREPEARARLGRAAAEHVRRAFDADDWQARLAGHYRELAGRTAADGDRTEEALAR